MQLFFGEARASPRGEFVMASHILNADAVYLHQLAQENLHALLLLWRASILRFAHKVASANVADADTLSISSRAMSTGNLFWSARFYPSVQSYHIMITATLPSSFLVPSVDIGNRKSLPFSCGRTMNNYLLYLSHDSQYPLCGCLD